MKQIVTITIVSLLVIAGTGIISQNAKGSLSSINAPITFEWYRLAEVDTDMDFAGTADFYYAVRLYTNNYGSNTYSTLISSPRSQDNPSLWPNDGWVTQTDMGGVRFAFQDFVQTIQPNANGDYKIRFTIGLWDDDDPLTDDVCDISPATGNGQSDYGFNWKTGTYLSVFYDVIDDTMTYWDGSSYLSASSHLSGSYYYFHGEEDGSTGNGDFDAGVRFAITDTYSDNTAPTTTSSLSPSSPNGENGWYTSNVQVTLSASDNSGGTGVDYTRYEVGDPTPDLTYGSPFTVSTEGTNTVYYYSVDCKNTETTRSKLIKIDKTAPGTATILSSTHTENIWSSNDDPSFTWNSVSDLSGVTYYYEWDHSVSTIPSGSSSISLGTSKSFYNQVNDDDWYFHIRTKNGAGLWGSTDHFGPIKIDDSSPAKPTISSSTHSSESTWYTSNDPAFSWTTVGGPSPVTYYYELDDSTPDSSKTGTTRTESNVPDGTHNFYVKATDTGGTSSTDSYTVKIDTTSPDSSVSSLSATQISTSFAVSWSGYDPHSGLKWYDIQYKDGAGSWTDWITQAINLSATFNGQDGHTYYFQSRAQDFIGNWEAYPGGNGDTTTTIDIPPDIGWIEGHVYEEDGTTPIQDASVSIDGGSSILTDASGHYNLSASPGSYTVNADKTGFNSDTESVTIITGQTTNQNFILTEIIIPPSAGWLEGQVYNGTTPLSGATITVNANTTITNSTGYYNISLSAGTYTATASINDYEPDSKSVTIYEAQATIQDFSLTYIDPSDLGWAVGFVYETGTTTPISEVTVTADAYTDETDPDGSYNLTLPTGTYTLTVTKTDYLSESESITIVAGQETSTILYLSIEEEETPPDDPKEPDNPSDGTIQGYVFITGTSIPINGVTISVQGDSSTTNAAGYYSLDVPAGTYTVTANHFDYVSDTKTATVNAGQTTTKDFYLNDNDDLSDTWEIEHFGDLAQLPGDDPDNDGFDNSEEYAGGTDPADGTDHPEDDIIEEPSVSNENIIWNPMFWIIIILIASAIIGAGLYSRKKKPPAREVQNEELAEPEESSQ